MSASVEVLSLVPADLAARVPLWELGVHAGDVGVAVIDGSAGDWNAAAAEAQADLPGAPVITVGVVRDTPVGGSAPALAAACDLLVETDNVDHRVIELVELMKEAGAPALIAAQLLRAAGSGVISESLAYSTLLAGDDFHAWRASKPPREPSDRGVPRIALERADAAWKLTLSRPTRHNAFDAQMREELCDALDAIRCEPEAPVVLLGAGPSFCSGGDLDEFGTADSPVAAHLIRTGRSVAYRLQRLAPRLIAGVHGRCLGAGIEFASFAQRVVAARDTTFALPELCLGLNLGAGGSISIPARIGRQRTLELLIRAEPIDAERALEWGLVDELVEPDALEDRCFEIAEAIA
jgi:enoyl-CoA hydratase/carnithine racemase